MIISPIFYMGNKKKLINKGLIDLFPSSIGRFIDLFAGSAIVSINTIANEYLLNDIDEHLIQLYQIFTNKPEDIIQHINKRIDEFGLAKERTSHIELNEENKTKIERYKNSYINFRNYYNETKYPLDLYTLMFYSFSQQFRFNSKGGFNMPCGNDCFAESNYEYIKNGCDFFNKNNIKLCNSDFRKFNIEEFTVNDFIYLDPPYRNTTATYNENNGWSEKDEDDLYAFCEQLNSFNIKWGLSNVFKSKNIVNDKLIKWRDLHNWNVYKFDKVSYSACGKGNSNAQEVYICNY